MSGFNQAILLGRLETQPEVLTSKSGKAYKAVISVTTYRKNAEGSGEEFRTNVPVTLFGRQAEVFQKRVRPGDMIHLTGRLDGNEWQRDGRKGISLSFAVE